MGIWARSSRGSWRIWWCSTADPLENIRNTESIRYVVANGRLFDAWTLNELGNQPRERGVLWWER